MSSSHPPFQSILVPLDGSPLAEQAIPIALAIAERAHSKLRFVLVHQIHQPLVLMEPGHLYGRNSRSPHYGEKHPVRMKRRAPAGRR